MEELFDKKDVFTVLNASEAEKYEGEVGYFANDLEGLKYSIRNNDSEVLTKVITSNDDDKPFWYDSPTGDREYTFALFLPEDKVKQKERKWVACRSVNLLLSMMNKRVGDALTYHKKGEATIHNCIITEIHFDDYCSFVVLGSKQFSAKTLFEDYEWREECQLNWRPFGMEVEE